jgi:hypothetical protein
MPFLAHRVILSIYLGRKLKSTATHIVHHICEEKRCVNPRHLIEEGKHEHLKKYHKNRGLREPQNRIDPTFWRSLDKEWHSKYNPEYNKIMKIIEEDEKRKRLYEERLGKKLT